MAIRHPDDGGFRMAIERAGWIQLARGIPVFFLLAVAAYAAWSSVYAVEEFEEAVVLRFGRYESTQGPGLHFKIPFVDEAVLVDTSEHSMRLPLESYRADEGRGGAQRVPQPGQEEALILTGDLYAAVVEWNVIWRVVEPKEYLFSIEAKQIQDTITAVARSTMNRIVGDYSADEILTGKREEIGLAALEEMQRILAQFDCGVQIAGLQMQRVTPPERVKPAFDEVNASIQTRDQLVNEANQERNRLIPMAEAHADRLIREAEGYAARRRAEAQGEIAALLAKYEAYRQAPEITRERMYLDAMQEILSNSGPKMILDQQLEGPLPLLNLGDGTPPFTSANDGRSEGSVRRRPRGSSSSDREQSRDTLRAGQETRRRP